MLDKCDRVIEQRRWPQPRGYVAPWWELSRDTVELLLENGIKYDHSQMDNDFTPFYARVGDSWTKIDYTKEAAEWMKPLVRGKRDRPRRDRGQLVRGRPAADDVHQGVAQQPRLRQSARHRGDVA